MDRLQHMHCAWARRHWKGACMCVSAECRCHLTGARTYLVISQGAASRSPASQHFGSAAVARPELAAQRSSQPFEAEAPPLCPRGMDLDSQQHFL